MTEINTASPRPTTGWWDYTEPAVPPILHGVLKSFVSSGYHGSTMRTLAASVGLSVPGLYHHFDSKQAMLVQLMELAMSDLYERSLAAARDAGDSIDDQLRLHIECLVLFHAHRSELAFIAANEIRSLEPETRAVHIAARDRQQRILDDIVERGVRSGAFTAETSRDASRAIVTMCTGVAQWYRLDGKLTPDALAANYVTLVRRALGQKV